MLLCKHHFPYRHGCSSLESVEVQSARQVLGTEWNSVSTGLLDPSFQRSDFLPQEIVHLEAHEFFLGYCIRYRRRRIERVREVLSELEVQRRLGRRLKQCIAAN